MKTASICTLGCRVNQYESDAIEEQLKKRGFSMVSFGERAQVAIINTCTVTAQSDKKSRQYVRRANADYVIVTGCFAQTSPEDAEKLEGVTLVAGNGEKDQLADMAAMLADGLIPEVHVQDTSDFEYDSLSVSTPKRARCYIKIEDGCENRCAYCIIPRARGRVRSKKPEKVLSEMNAIAATGCKEVILTGIETASYGRDFGKDSFAELLLAADRVDGIHRITMGSLEPTVMTEAFVRELASMAHLLPHFHLSVQSGCTRTLNRMRRRYKADAVIQSIALVRRYIPEATFSADIIVGFPGETEADFEETVAFCRQAGFIHLHIFPFSIREGTEAADMPDQIPDVEKKRRAARLARVQDKIKRELLDRYIEEHREKPVYVLGEKWENGVTNGHTEHFIECDIETDDNGYGKILPFSDRTKRVCADRKCK